MTKLYIKEGVKINGAHFDTVMVDIIEVARDTAPPTTDGAIWITSANDGTHKVGSLHYKNRAFDFRTRNIIGDVTAEATQWLHRMKENLGLDYDVLLEGDHLHVEYDPKS